jgi:hypothetical protein
MAIRKDMMLLGPSAVCAYLRGVGGRNAGERIGLPARAAICAWAEESTRSHRMRGRPPSRGDGTLIDALRFRSRLKAIDLRSGRMQPGSELHRERPTNDVERSAVSVCLRSALLRMFRARYLVSTARVGRLQMAAASGRANLVRCLDAGHVLVPSRVSGQGKRAVPAGTGALPFRRTRSRLRYNPR